MIRCYIEGKVRNWDVDLPLLVMALHATENRLTGYTPNSLMLGREVVLPVDIVTGMASLTLTDYEPDEWVRHLDWTRLWWNPIRLLGNNLTVFKGDKKGSMI